MALPRNGDDHDIRRASAVLVRKPGDTEANLGRRRRSACGVARPDYHRLAGHRKTASETATLLTSSAEDTNAQRTDVGKAARIRDGFRLVAHEA